MDQTGDTAKQPSEDADYSKLDLYGGPLDGYPQTIPTYLISKTYHIRIIQPMNQFEFDRYSKKYPAIVTADKRPGMMHVYKQDSIQPTRYNHDFSYML